MVAEHQIQKPWVLFDHVHSSNGFTAIGLNMDFRIRVDPEGQYIYVEFKGSDGFSDWFHNLLAIPQTIEPIEGCGFRVHRGFNRVWQSGGDYILCALEGFLSRRQFQDFKVAFTGFSHGGPLAVLASNQWFHQTNRVEDCIIFGSPKVAHGHNAVTALQRTAHHIHWANQQDAVIHVPPRKWGFEDINRVFVSVPGNRPWSILNIWGQHQAYGRDEIYPDPLPRPWAA